MCHQCVESCAFEYLVYIKQLTAVHVSHCAWCLLGRGRVSERGGAAMLFEPTET